MSLLTLFARKEPTTDPVSLRWGPKGKKDTVVYQDEACTQFVARYHWYQSSCPRRGQKRTTLNCWDWALTWAQ